MTRRLALLTLLVTGLVALPAAGASARVLQISEAKKLAAKQAEKVKQDLRSEGASRAKVPGCWRMHAKKVGCYFSVYGYDRELDFKWQCMLRVVVRLRERPAAKGPYRVTYGRPVCG